jgi:hypothetical protein
MRSRDSIRKRGKSSWRIKWEIERDVDGKRQTRWQTIHGSRQDAQKALTALLAGRDAGSYVDPSAQTVAQYLDSLMADPRGARGRALEGKTLERRVEIIRTLIVPHLGHVMLQQLKPGHIENWHRKLLTAGGRDRKPLAPATVRLAHGILRAALARAMATELVTRNVCDIIRAPSGQRDKVEILTADTIATMLDVLRGHPLETLATVALFTGARRIAGLEVVGYRFRGGHPADRTVYGADAARWHPRQGPQDASGTPRHSPTADRDYPARDPPAHADGAAAVPRPGEG